MMKVVGTAPNQVPSNADLGELAYLDKEYVDIVGRRVDALDDRVDALELDASNTAGFTAESGKNYWLRGTFSVTLPDTTGLGVGSHVRFSKAIDATPTIQVGAGGAHIVTSGGTDTSVLFDLDADILFVFNGTDWEL